MHHPLRPSSVGCKRFLCDCAKSGHPQWSEIQSACRVKSLALENCSTETECSIAAVELQKCTGKIVCPDVVQRFNKCVQSDSNVGVKADVSDDLEKAYGALVKCLEMFEMTDWGRVAKPENKNSKPLSNTQKVP